jgi:hypothetical protein
MIDFTLPENQEDLSRTILNGLISSTLARDITSSPLLVYQLAYSRPRPIKTDVSPTPLAKLDKARLLLQQTRTLPEIKKIRDLAVAAKAYARAAKLSQESYNYAFEIEKLAQRKALEFVQTKEKNELEGRIGPQLRPI